MSVTLYCDIPAACYCEGRQERVCSPRLVKKTRCRTSPKITNSVETQGREELSLRTANPGGQRHWEPKHAAVVHTAALLSESASGPTRTATREFLGRFVCLGSWGAPHGRLKCFMKAREGKGFRRNVEREASPAVRTADVAILRTARAEVEGRFLSVIPYDCDP
ncbi:Hypp7659 [Branchiostoma lanceolatum]|uniref:Hypp7659 protein n=1 Tax=Branchiostoma lanceolatum TaxID=7740 RepID=A0A8J9Z2U3_BRALA|nr:Hypp7659 [Branchiostoma lanceolatum]